MKTYKKLILGLLCVVLVGALVGTLAGCDLFDRLGSDDSQFVITYYLDDNSAPRTATVTNGTFTLTTIPTDEYRTFAGLYDERVGGMQIVDAQGNCYIKIDRDMTLYAHWVYVDCTIVFDPNGGELDESLQTMTVPYASTLTKFPIPSKDGFTFLGWYDSWGNTRYSQGGDVLEAKQKLNATNYDIYERTVYLSARYDISEYTLTLDYNDGSNKQETIPIRHGNSLNSISLPEVDTGTSLIVGWSTSPYMLTEFTGPFEGDLTLYAIWKDYKIFYLYYNTNSSNRPTEIKVFRDEVYKLPTPTRTGYTFDGWYENSYFSGNPVESITYTTPNSSFYARWLVKTYTISLDANGGTVGNSSKTVQFDQSFTLPVPSRKGYLFDGWFCSGSRVTNKNGQPVSAFTNEDWVHLSAKWYNSGSFSDTTKKRITDSSAASQYHNELTVTSIFGYSLDQLKQLGITKISFYVVLNIAEINDGYQELFFSRAVSTSSSYLIWSKTNIEHGPGTKKTSSADHTFSFDVSIDSMSETFYILYSAHGSLDDDWYRNSIRVTFTLS